MWPGVFATERPAGVAALRRGRATEPKRLDAPPRAVAAGITARAGATKEKKAPGEGEPGAFGVDPVWGHYRILCGFAQGGKRTHALRRAQCQTGARNESFPTAKIFCSAKSGTACEIWCLYCFNPHIRLKERLTRLVSESRMAHYIGFGPPMVEVALGF